MGIAGPGAAGIHQATEGYADNPVLAPRWQHHDPRRGRRVHHHGGAQPGSPAFQERCGASWADESEESSKAFEQPLAEMAGLRLQPWR